MSDHSSEDIVSQDLPDVTLTAHEYLAYLELREAARTLALEIEQRRYSYLRRAEKDSSVTPSVRISSKALLGLVDAVLPFMPESTWRFGDGGPTMRTENR